jgi:hypothetical protein
VLAAATIVIHDAADAWPTLLVGGVLGVAGTLTGGLVAGWVGLHTEDKRQAFSDRRDAELRERDDERERRVLIGIARVLSTQLKAAEYTVQNSKKTGAWWPTGALVRPDMAIDDLKLLATQMNPDHWAGVAAALHVIEINAVVRAYAPEIQDDGTLPPVDQASSDSMPKTVNILRIAQLAIAATLQALGSPAA